MPATARILPFPQAGGTSAVVCGLGTWVPPRVVPNAEIAARLDTSDEWIHARTGIRERHVVDPGMATSDLAVEAGQRALKSADTDRVDALVLATTTPDRPCPATAPDVAHRLGLDRCAAFDVNAVCTGFLYGLASGAGLIAAGVAEQVLVIGADTFTTIIDPDCRATAAIFGDGAGAVVLRAGSASEPGALGPFDLGSDGQDADLITVAAGGSRQRSTRRPAEPGAEFFTMAGKAVFRKAIFQMAGSAQTVLRKAGLGLRDIDRFVIHQANARILNGVADMLGQPVDKFVRNIDQVGNTAAASVPLALDAACASGELRPGQRVLLGAFGGGLTWGSTVLRWPELEAV
ncbi:3-oxoacyl-ACP synthase [Actinophytocola xinjiangensis]|uniref:Beta-ketoacyl-[acyl-carrier-protein] synthase III n=1 Tax=Actinophytocola xinjiangensis TaxID=485602 RepID=A0A7Z0WEI4_9PSEU|nr:beta-ketoacyl-ACP synthase III [Actinophytocola xinjiangensis]OLF05382.1 3-oxoacyl-ACP synthase [Actinophytocola xinjiangensis]